MATIKGMVTDRHTGRGLKASTIKTSTGQEIKADDDGRYTLAEIPTGPLNIKVSKGGFDAEEKTIVIKEEETLTVNFPMRPGKSSEGWIETIKTVVYAVLIALFIRTVAYEPFNIPSGSMEPTLLVGDYLFVSKLSYGYSRYSLPGSLPVIPGRIFNSSPKRGDVAVFKLPADTSKDYIKRIIGLPGDRIQMQRGRLYINGKMVPRRRVKNYVYEPNSLGRRDSVAQFIETLPNGVEHLILEAAGDFGQLDDTREFRVPEGHYFAMGDNRDRSQDSRTRAVGPIPEVNLVGRADVLFFSINDSAAWWEVWKWPGGIRYGRLFNLIE